jgi:hypothetical protein
LKVLGCKAYVQIPKERCTQSDKLRHQAAEGKLVSFKGDHIYRVYIPSQRGIVRTSTADFDETEPVLEVKALDDASNLYEPDQAEDPSAELPDRVFKHRGANAISNNDDESINQQLAQEVAEHQLNQDPPNEAEDSSDEESPNEIPARALTQRNRGLRAKRLDPSNLSTYLANTSFRCLPQHI